MFGFKSDNYLATVRNVESVSVSRTGRALASHLINSGRKTVALCDCDGTLNHDDVLDFATNEAINQSSITELFKRYPNYCFDAFYEVSQHFQKADYQTSITHMLHMAEQKVVLNPVMAELLTTLVMDSVPIVLVSSGFPEVWANRLGLEDMVIGGACFARHGCIVSDQSKTQLARRLSGQGIKVIAFGNGRADLGMLEYSTCAYYIYSSQPKTTHLTVLSDHRNLTKIKLEGFSHA